MFCSFCVRSWGRRLELACLWVGWPQLRKLPCLWAFQEPATAFSAPGISCLHFWAETAACPLRELWCLFLANLLFNLLPLCFTCYLWVVWATLQAHNSFFCSSSVPACLCDVDLVLNIPIQRAQIMEMSVLKKYPFLFHSTPAHKPHQGLLTS